MDIADEASQRLSDARRRGDTVSVLATAGTTIIVIAKSVEPATSTRLSLADAACAGATTVRVIRDAIRTGALNARGRQRDRSVSRADLDAWIESRAVKPHPAIDDRDLDRRMARLRSAKAANGGVR